MILLRNIGRTNKGTLGFFKDFGGVAKNDDEPLDLKVLYLYIGILFAHTYKVVHHHFRTFLNKITYLACVPLLVGPKKHNNNGKLKMYLRFQRYTRVHWKW